MKNKRIHLRLFAGLLLAACSGSQYQITNDGVILNLKQEKKADANKLRLQVLSIGMLQERTFVIVPVNKNKNQGFIYDAKGQRVSYDGHKQTISIQKS